jgi:short-subunit dehydrogenase
MGAGALPSRKVAVITGASSGIGRATAEEFARHGYAVVVLARRKDRLEKLVSQLSRQHAHLSFLAIPCDVTKWKDVQAAADQIAAKYPKIHVLVNNAGAYNYGTLEDIPHEKMDEIIDVNIRGVIYVTKALLPLLKLGAKDNSAAKIVNVSSIGGLWGFPKMSVYTASKFAVTGFSSAMRRELKEHGIDVASIHPGPVNSTDTPPAEAERKRMVMLPPQIAKQIYALAASKRRQHISHPAFTLLHALEYVSPEFVDRLLKRILK